MDWRFVISLLFAIIVAIFAIQNAGAVNIGFFSWNVYVSQALVILISAVFGAVTVLLLSLIRRIRYGSKIKSSAKTIATLEEENRQLKQKIEESLEKEEKLEKSEKPEKPAEDKKEVETV